jgi:uncharacterized protein (TIGR00266 family)
MKYEILYQPSFAVARIMLDPGDAIRAEAGAMLSMSPTIELESKMHGGFGKALGRLFGGESMFQSTFSAARGAGEVLLAPPGPGDVLALPMTGPGMMVTSGCYLAGDISLQLETVATMKGFFAGEGLFMLRVSGAGALLLSSFGAVIGVQLAPGQQYIVDTGHLVAFSEGMEFNIRRATRTLTGMMTSGEGTVAELTGPGMAYIQTRTPRGFAAWLSTFGPARR